MRVRARRRSSRESIAKTCAIPSEPANARRLPSRDHAAAKTVHLANAIPQRNQSLSLMTKGRRYYHVTSVTEGQLNTFEFPGHTRIRIEGESKVESHARNKSPVQQSRNAGVHA